MFYEIAQTALTHAIEAIFIGGLGAIFIDATIGEAIREVRSWRTPGAAPMQIEETVQQSEETTVTPAEISELAKELVTEVMPATDAALEALEEVQQPTLAEDLGLVPPSYWGKVTQPAVRKPATTKARHTPRSRTTKKSA